ncbi:MAG: aminotransferase class I/II-fold pyridoxal phosphate-dependent enzyme [Clostridia bacterium]|nr:aminotransferase class I/II-fold pyridoxal phosphate-dependent enzyme [Clostridia bacterium]
MIDYSKVLSQTVVDTPKSGIRKFFDLMSSMKDVVGLTVGEPDFQTPWHIREAGIESLEKGKTYYTANAGLLELRSEINHYMTRRFHVSYDPTSEIIVTVGGSEAIDIAFRSVIEPGDEVIVPTPSFVCYAPLARMAGGVPVILETRAEDQFKITPEALKAAITPKTKMLVLPYPNNPTGAIMTREELTEIAEILQNTNILVLSDEIYAEMTYTGTHCSIASLEGMWERTVIASGFSKAYAMTGWRMGYLCAPKPLAEQMLKIHQYGIMSSPTTAQFAAIEALKNGEDDIRMMVDEYNRRRRYIYNGLKSIGIESFEPEGAFYIFPRIGDYGMSGDEFCNKLLYDYKCAIVPGSAFGAGGDGFARISYAYSIKHITLALERIEQFVKTL